MSLKTLRIADSKKALFCLAFAGIFVFNPLTDAKSSAQMVGPSLPMARPAKAKTAPIASNQTTTEVKNALKGFFKPTGRTITPSKPASAEANADKTAALPEETEPVELKLPEAQEEIQTSASPPQRPPMLALPPLGEIQIAEPVASVESPPLAAAKRIDAKDNPLGLAAAKNDLQAVQKMLDNKQFEPANDRLFPLRQWLVDSTEAHINLYKALGKLPSAQVQAEFEKQLALEFAKLRDASFVETGRYYMGTNQPQKAVKELVQVVQSQTKTDLGLKAYQLLQQVGFTEQLQLTN